MPTYVVTTLTNIHTAEVVHNQSYVIGELSIYPIAPWSGGALKPQHLDRYARLQALPFQGVLRCLSPTKILAPFTTEAQMPTAVAITWFLD